MIQRSFFRVTALLLALCVAGIALATPQPGDDNPVSVKAVPQHAAVEQGGQVVVAVILDHKTGFHTWPSKEVSLGKDIDEFAIRTEITLPIDEKATDAAQKAARDAKKPDAVVDAIRIFQTPAWLALFDGVQFPETHKGKVPDPNGGDKPLTVPLYSGKAVAFVRLKVKPDAAVGDQTFNIRVAYQSCNEQICTPPQDITVPVTTKIVKKGDKDAGLTADSDASLFKTFDGKWKDASGATPATAPKVELPPAPKTEPKPETPKHSAVPAQGEARTPPSGGATLYGWHLGSNALLIFIVAALGGAVLNLTPCVLPVIPIKILSLTQHAKNRRHALILGMWMAAGVVAFWTVIGLPMAVFSRSLDPSQFIFGVWWITFGIGLLIAIFGLGIIGLFSLNLPQSVYAIETKADSPAGSFLYGVMAGVLGLPCFGFVAGGLLAAASTLPTLAILAIFVGLGVGMASPYLLLSAYPQLLKFVPRTGPASELVKQVMGILLLAAAAYFITAGIQGLLIERPYLSGSMTWWAVGFFVLIASIWMFLRTVQITRRPVMLSVIAVLAVAMTLGIGVFANGRLESDRETYFERQAAMRDTSHGPKDVPAGVWLEYTPELFAAVRANGQPVFLDFTANWCITCKALKAAVLDDLKATFKSRGVVLMEVDCTVKSSPGSTKLRELGRTGVPTWVVYGPGSDTPRFIPVETPTAGTILAELDAAGITAPSSSAMDSKPR